MVKRLGSRQRKTRHKFMATTREKGKISLAEYFKELQQGDLVNLAIHPNVFKGRFYRRFHGKSGIVNGKKGRCYGVQVKDGEKQKLLYVHPIHLRKQSYSA